MSMSKMNKYLEALTKNNKTKYVILHYQPPTSGFSSGYEVAMEVANSLQEAKSIKDKLSEKGSKSIKIVKYDI